MANSLRLLVTRARVRGAVILPKTSEEKRTTSQETTRIAELAARPVPAKGNRVLRTKEAILTPSRSLLRLFKTRPDRCPLPDRPASFISVHSRGTKHSDVVRAIFLGALFGLTFSSLSPLTAASSFLVLVIHKRILYAGYVRRIIGNTGKRSHYSQRATASHTDNARRARRNARREQ